MTDHDAGARRRAAAATLSEARRLFETTALKQVEIAEQVGRSEAWLSRRAKQDGWVRPVEAERRAALIRNVRAKVDAEIAKTEKVFEGLGPATDAERSARTLASLMRTLREISKYDEERARAAQPAAVGATARGGAGGDCSRHPDELVDIDDFRDSLADRLDRLRQERDG